MEIKTERTDNCTLVCTCDVTEPCKSQHILTFVLFCFVFIYSSLQTLNCILSSADKVCFFPISSLWISSYLINPHRKDCLQNTYYFSLKCLHFTVVEKWNSQSVHCIYNTSCLVQRQRCSYPWQQEWLSQLSAYFFKATSFTEHAAGLGSVVLRSNAFFYILDLGQLNLKYDYNVYLSCAHTINVEK